MTPNTELPAPGYFYVGSPNTQPYFEYRCIAVVEDPYGELVAIGWMEIGDDGGYEIDSMTTWQWQQWKRDIPNMKQFPMTGD